MARNRNKKVNKLRRYRDKLLQRITNLEGMVRHGTEVLWEIRKALQNENHLRAYALASDEEGSQQVLRHVDKNELVKELALTYRMLNVERKYSADIQVAARQRDYLRVAALSADHQAESIAHDKMLSTWSKDHGFTKSVRKEMEDEDIK